MLISIVASSAVAVINKVWSCARFVKINTYMDCLKTQELIIVVGKPERQVRQASHCGSKLFFFRWNISVIFSWDISVTETFRWFASHL